jgi:hypothetical protein
VTQRLGSKLLADTVRTVKEEHPYLALGAVLARLDLRLEQACQVLRERGG